MTRAFLPGQSPSAVESPIIGYSSGGDRGSALAILDPATRVMTPATLAALDRVLTTYARQRTEQGHTEAADAARPPRCLASRTSAEAIAAADYLRRDHRDPARRALARTAALALATLVRLDADAISESAA